MEFLIKYSSGRRVLSCFESLPAVDTIFTFSTKFESVKASEIQWKFTEFQSLIFFSSAVLTEIQQLFTKQRLLLIYLNWGFA